MLPGLINIDLFTGNGMFYMDLFCILITKMRHNLLT